LKSLLKRCYSGLCFPTIGHSHQQPDPPRSLALLRARRERPGDGAAEECDELAAFQSRG
jgi:hypothetical protein